MQAGRVEIEIAAKDTNFPKTAATIRNHSKGIEGALAGVDRQAQKTDLSLGGLAKAAAGLFVFGKVAGFLQDSVRAAGQAAEANAKVTAAIKSTGGAAGLAVGELEAMAAGLQKVTTFEDDAIMASQALLLTFTKIGKNVFPQATETILNMSAALGQDLKSSAIQLGKALNEPVEGISALSRVGVQLTKDQEALIKSFVRVGDVESAQKVILRELEVQMGGVARATAKTGIGPLLQFRNVIGDIQEDLGNALLPALTETAKKVQAFVLEAKESGKVEQVFRSFAGAVQWTVENVDKLAIVGSGLLAVFAVEKLVAVATAIKGIGLAVAAATAANPALLALGVAATAAGVAFVAARDGAKAFNEEAQNIEAAEKQLAKYESVAQKVAALHKNMQENNPFGDDKYAPKGAKRLPSAPGVPATSRPQTDEEIKAAETRAKETLAARRALEDSQVGLIQDKTEQQLQALDLRFQRERAALGANVEAITLLGQAYHNEEKAILAARAAEVSELRLQQAVDINTAIQAERARDLALAEEAAQRHMQLDRQVSDSKWGLAQAMAGAFGKLTGASKAAFLVSKGLAGAQIWMNTLAGATAAVAPPPLGIGPILGPALSAKIMAMGKVQLATLAATTIAGFEQGGIVPGNKTSGDQVPAMVNSREMILTQRQQANLFAMANGRGESRGGGVSIGDIVINLPAGASEEDGRRAGRAASETILSRLRGHVRDSDRAEYLGVRA